METALVALGAGGFVALLVLAVLVVLLARRGTRDRAELESLLAAARRDADDLRRRLQELSARLELAPTPDTADFVITSAGQPEPAPGPAVPDRLVLSATVGEPLVKAAAFTYGVRRALSPASRNRIWFEMRREVRASRKRRRRLVKEFLRDVRAQERAQETVA